MVSVTSALENSDDLYMGSEGVVRVFRPLTATLQCFNQRKGGSFERSDRGNELTN